MKTNGDRPAFPVPNPSCPAIGLTKREYFAGQAMQGYMASYAGTDCNLVASHIAEVSVRLTDALLAELEEEVK